MRSSLPILLTKIVNVLTSLCLCAFGVTVIVLPDRKEVLALVLGILLILLGAFKLAGYFSKDLFRLAFEYDLQIGIILALLGIGVLINRDDWSFALSAFGIAVFTDGLFAATIAVDSKSFGIKLWKIILVSAIAACVIGAALLLIPAQTGNAPSIMLGIALILEGILHLTVILSTVKIIRHQLPDRSDSEK